MKSCTRLICISRSLSVIGPFQMISTSASLAPAAAPACTAFQNSCDVALGTTASTSFSRCLLGRAAGGLTAATPEQGQANDDRRQHAPTQHESDPPELRCPNGESARSKSFARPANRSWCSPRAVSTNRVGRPARRPGRPADSLQSPSAGPTLKLRTPRSTYSFLAAPQSPPCSSAIPAGTRPPTAARSSTCTSPIGMSSSSRSSTPIATSRCS